MTDEAAPVRPARRPLLRSPAKLAALILGAIVLGLLWMWNSNRHEELHPGGYRLFTFGRDLSDESILDIVESADKPHTWVWLEQRCGVQLPRNAEAWKAFLSTQPDRDFLLGLWDVQDRLLISGRFFLEPTEEGPTMAWQPIELEHCPDETGFDLQAMFDSHPQRDWTNGEGSGPHGSLSARLPLTTFDKVNRIGMAGDQLGFVPNWSRGWQLIRSDKLIAVRYMGDPDEPHPDPRWLAFILEWDHPGPHRVVTQVFADGYAILDWVNERYRETNLAERIHLEIPRPE